MVMLLLADPFTPADIRSSKPQKPSHWIVAKSFDG
jgi:hypothetical protein